jgi:hypothetical protein
MKKNINHRVLQSAYVGLLRVPRSLNTILVFFSVQLRVLRGKILGADLIIGSLKRGYD